jgi:pyruvate kinase
MKLALLALCLAPAAAFAPGSFLSRVRSTPKTTLRMTTQNVGSDAAVGNADDQIKSAIRSELSSRGMLSSPTGPRWAKSTKQVATLGPASFSEEMMEKLFLAGVGVFRVNFSHGVREDKAEVIGRIRALEAKHNHPIAILADLQGPKLRVSTFENDETVTVSKGDLFRFDLDDTPGDKTRVKLPHPEIIETLALGDTLLIDDGKVRMTVVEKGHEFISCQVDVGGKLSNRKGVNTPSVVLPISALTPKDRADLDVALELGADWVALSFVQKADDMRELRKIVRGRAKVLAKLEKPSAVGNMQTLEEIVDLSDGIMVARGDLGVEMMPEDVPIMQKRIIETCNIMGKPVIVATQMLESMIEAPTPTRAEASDVATALYDGADAVMLSGESAMGLYPVEAVSMQQRVISRVEDDALYRELVTRSLTAPERTATDAITFSARQVASTVGAKAIVVFTQFGTTVNRAAKGRPGVPIVAITPDIKVARELAMVWGVHPCHVPEMNTESFEDMLKLACEITKEHGFVSEPTDLVVATGGLPFGTPGAANVLRVISAAGPDEWDPSLCDIRTEECGPDDEMY